MPTPMQQYVAELERRNEDLTERLAVAERWTPEWFINPKPRHNVFEAKLYMSTIILCSVTRQHASSKFCISYSEDLYKVFSDDKWEFKFSDFRTFDEVKQHMEKIFKAMDMVHKEYKEKYI
jgi:hypothetical protein